MSEIMINVETEQLNSNHTPKVKLIKSILEDIKKQKEARYRCFGYYENLSMYSKSFINTLDAIPVNPAILILALSSTTMSGIIRIAIRNRYRFQIT